MRASPVAVVLATLFTASACGADRSDAPPDQAGVSAADTAGAMGPADSAVGPTDRAETGGSGAGATPMTVQDVERYERGLLAEIGEVETAVRRLRDAKTGTDTLAAMTGGLARTTEPVGAEAAGLPLDRYRAIGGTMDEVFGARAMRGGVMDGMGSVDTSALSPEQREQIRRNRAEMEVAWGDPYASLPADVAQAVKARADSIEALRTRLLSLRFQAAGQGGR